MQADPVRRKIVSECCNITLNGAANAIADQSMAHRIPEAVATLLSRLTPVDPRFAPEFCPHCSDLPWGQLVRQSARPPSE